MDAYLYRISRYKCSTNQKERDEFIQRAEARFPDRWELTLTIAYSYMFDFPFPSLPNHEICMKYLKRTLELNPQEFNTMLLLTVAVDEKVKNEYLKKMYVLHPEAFSKNMSSSDAKKYPYKGNYYSHAL